MLSEEYSRKNLQFSEITILLSNEMSRTFDNVIFERLHCKLGCMFVHPLFGTNPAAVSLSRVLGSGP